MYVRVHRIKVMAMAGAIPVSALTMSCPCYVAGVTDHIQQAARLGFWGGRRAKKGVKLWLVFLTSSSALLN